MIGRKFFNSIIFHSTDKSLDLYCSIYVYHFLIYKRHSNEQSKE